MIPLEDMVRSSAPQKERDRAYTSLYDYQQAPREFDIRIAENIFEIIHPGPEALINHNSIAYNTEPNPRYTFAPWYSLRFLRPVEVASGKLLGFPETLGGINYGVDTGIKQARNDWIHDDADNIITHEIIHDGPLFHGINPAEYWTRLIHAARPQGRHMPHKSHQPVYNIPPI